jgi:acetyl esterase/lipase
MSGQAHTEGVEEPMATPPSEAIGRRHFYGPDPSQYADLHSSRGARQPGTVVLIHGGWWRSLIGADHLAGVAADLATRGWTTWNIEYRRVGIGGGYPFTLEDVAAAVDHLATLSDLDLSRVVAVGHSAGGHLAAWAAGRAKLAAGSPGADPVVGVSGVISLAGAVDLVSAARQRLGGGAAIEFLGGDPDQWPERYVVADPMAVVPIAAAVRAIHGRADEVVPIAQSAAYVEAARAGGQDAELVPVEGDHMTVTDIASLAWPTVIKALEKLTRS